jgi:hypothetical protein
MENCQVHLNLALVYFTFITSSVFGDPGMHARGGKNGCPAGQYTRLRSQVT